MKRICLFFVALFLCNAIWAQDEKLRIAVFDPTSSGTSIDEGTKIAIREIISSTIVNTGKHSIVERSLLEKVMEEQSLSISGVVDDSQMTEIGKLAGANKIIVSVVTLTGGRNMLSIKMIDVQTANVERQKVKIVTSGELLDVVEPMTLSLIGEQADERIIQTSSSEQPAGESHIQNSIPVSEQNIVPGKDEIVVYMPSGYEPANEKDRAIVVTLDKDMIGSGTLSDGFLLRIKSPGKGEHVLKAGGCKIKFDPSEYNYFEFQIHRWNYLGKTMYGVRLKEKRFITQ